ncbi:MAG: hypothetical protein HHJ09_10605 [Glaciimonas sp.]|nr:hypothetical protein [Glaciimonas sp.]
MIRKTTLESAFDVAARYLPTYHYSERHAIASVDAAPAVILSAMKNYDDRQDKVLNTLLTVREWPSRAAAVLGRKNALHARTRFGLDDFCLLEETSREITFGLIGRFWKLDYGLFPIASAADFQDFQQPGVAKLVMSFAVEPNARGNWRLMTETRIWCPDTKSRLMLLPYWVVIRLASGWIRLRTLNQIKKNAEQAHHHPAT